MKRYLVALAFSLSIFALYHFSNLNFFNLDIARRVRQALFRTFAPPPWVESRVLLLNLGMLDPQSAISKIDSLLQYNPEKIGIDVCAYPLHGIEILHHFGENNKVVVSDCHQDSPKNVSSMIVTDDNSVTHFDTSQPNTYELQLTEFSGRGNKRELINYRRTENYFKAELADLSSIDASLITDNIVLVGYVGDYISDDVYYSQNAHITPLNDQYGHSHIPPDMYRLFISANIISTIINQEFIDEIGNTLSAVILLIIIAANVAILSFVRTKWAALNLTVAFISFFLLNMAGTILIVLLFDSGYYLAIDGLTICLLLTTISTIVLNYRDRKT